MAWEAGEAQMVLSADASALKAGMAKAKRTMLGMRKSMGRIASGIGRSLKFAFAAGAAGAAAAAAGIGYAVKQASDAQETLSRFRQVFDEQAKAAASWADEFARSVGRSRYAVRDAMTSFQGFFVGLGFGGDEAAKMSRRMQRLATDFASFHNLTDEEAMQRFVSALSGSSEVLDRFGVNIKQAALQQELLRMGIQESVAEVDEQSKAMARMNIIMRSMTQQGAVGDAVRTADELANAWRRTKAEIHDFTVDVGRTFMPVVSGVLEQIRALVGWLKQFGGIAKQTFLAATEVGKAYFGALTSWLSDSRGGVENLVRWVGEKLRDAFLAAAYTVRNLGKIFAWAFTWGKGQVLAFKDTFVAFFTEDVPELLAWFLRNWKAIFKDLGDLTVRYVKGYVLAWQQGFLELFEWISSGFEDGIDWQAPVRAFARQFEGFKRRTEALPELFDAGMSESTKRVLKRADGMFSDLTSGWEAYRSRFLSQFTEDAEEEVESRKKVTKQQQAALDVAEKREEAEEATADAVERQKAAFVGLTQLWSRIAAASAGGPSGGGGGGTSGGRTQDRRSRESLKAQQAAAQNTREVARLLRKGLPAVAV